MCYDDVREFVSPSPQVCAPLRHESIESVLEEVTDTAGQDEAQRQFLVRWQGRLLTEDSWLSEDELRRFRAELLASREDADDPKFDGAELPPPREDDEDHLTDEAFYAVVKTHKRRSNKIYNSELTMTKI